MRSLICLAALTLLCSTATIPAFADPVKVGDQVALGSGSLCISKDAAEVVAMAARRTGSGQSEWEDQVALGACQRVGGFTGTIVAIVDSYPESAAATGQEDILEFAIDGTTKHVYIFAPHGAILAGLPL